MSKTTLENLKTAGRIAEIVAATFVKIIGLFEG